MYASCNLARSIKTGDGFAAGIKHMALLVDHKSAHGVVGGGCQRTYGEQGIVERIGCLVVGAVLKALYVANGICGVSLAYIGWLGAVHHCHIVVAYSLEYGVGSNVDVELLKELGQLSRLAGVLLARHVDTALLVRLGGLLTADIQVGSLLAVKGYAVIEGCCRQDIALKRLVDETTAAAGADEHCITASDTLPNARLP